MNPEAEALRGMAHDLCFEGALLLALAIALAAHVALGGELFALIVVPACASLGVDKLRRARRFFAAARAAESIP